MSLLTHYSHFGDRVFPSQSLALVVTTKQEQLSDRTHKYTTPKVALVNSTTDTLKKTQAKRQDRQSLVQSPFMTSGQETEQVYSYNPRAHTGLHRLIFFRMLCLAGEVQICAIITENQQHCPTTSLQRLRHTGTALILDFSRLSAYLQC